MFILGLVCYIDKQEEGECVYGVAEALQLEAATGIFPSPEHQHSKRDPGQSAFLPNRGGFRASSLPNLEGIVVQLQPPPDRVTLQPRFVSTKRLGTTGSIIARYT